MEWKLRRTISAATPHASSQDMGNLCRTGGHLSHPCSAWADRGRLSHPSLPSSGCFHALDGRGELVALTRRRVELELRVQEVHDGQVEVVVSVEREAVVLGVVAEDLQPDLVVLGGRVPDRQVLEHRLREERRVLRLRHVRQQPRANRGYLEAPFGSQPLGLPVRRGFPRGPRSFWTRS